MRSVVATLLLALALRTFAQQAEEELPFDDLMATVCRKLRFKESTPSLVRRQPIIVCIGFSH